MCVCVCVSNFIRVFFQWIPLLESFQNVTIIYFYLVPFSNKSYKWLKILIYLKLLLRQTPCCVKHIPVSNTFFSQTRTNSVFILSFCRRHTAVVSSCAYEALQLALGLSSLRNFQFTEMPIVFSVSIQ